MKIVLDDIIKTFGKHYNYKNYNNETCYDEYDDEYMNGAISHFEHFFPNGFDTRNMDHADIMFNNSGDYKPFEPWFIQCLIEYLCKEPILYLLLGITSTHSTTDSEVIGFSSDVTNSKVVGNSHNIKKVMQSIKAKISPM